MNGSKKRVIARRNVSKKIASRLRSASQSEAARQERARGEDRPKGEQIEPAKRAKHQ